MNQNRHTTAIECMRNASTDLKAIARNFAEAIDEAEAEGCDPTSDAAVMLIGMKLSFMVHADVGGPSVIRQLLETCGARRKAPVQIVEEQH